MLDYLGMPGRRSEFLERAQRVAFDAQSLDGASGMPDGCAWLDNELMIPTPLWPLPNVWLGVSAEDQKAADERLPLLLKTSAAVRFLSVEPMIGPVDLTEALRGHQPTQDQMDPSKTAHAARYLRHGAPLIDWIICGGESGPGARPMHPDWARSIRNQCVEAGVPFFFKQWGAWGAHGQFDRSKTNGQIFAAVSPSGEYDTGTTCWNGRKQGEDLSGEWQMYRVGKKAAGRELDGRTWDEKPEVRS